MLKQIILSWKKHDKTINIVLGSIAVIIISCVAAQIIPRSAKAQENIKNNEILKIIIQIDDIAHQQDKMLHTLSGYNMEWDKVYHAVDNKYHAAQDRDEKIKQARKLNELIIEQNTFLHQIITENPFSEKAEETFNKLQEEITQIQQK